MLELDATKPCTVQVARQRGVADFLAGEDSPEQPLMRRPLHSFGSLPVFP